MEKRKIYFPNLNSLRFIAALMVIIHHVEQFKSIYQIDNYWSDLAFIKSIGKLGVLLFFVLSGFLITYLLVSEESNFNKIDIYKFYIRRVLRIWPLYFLILILAFFILPQFDFFIVPDFNDDTLKTNHLLRLILYVFFLPNLSLSFQSPVTYASQAWSIGTEEQFYLIWPIFIRFMKRQRLFFMFFIVFAYWVIYILLSSSYANLIPCSKLLRYFWRVFNIDCMAIGGIFALLSFYNSSWLKWLTLNSVFYASIATVLLLILSDFYIMYVHYQFFSALFGIIILNLATNKNIKIQLENIYFN